ncbi:hypothetical protein A9Q99_06495 [Gammaproteobacteria bacterium 45_16_T64]|nr:hypothetical protein A9Q99_06495 [Gammaproteobacteria bacterium 45_16_T64]
MKFLPPLIRPLMLLLSALCISTTAHALEFYGQGSLAISQPDSDGDVDLTLTTSPRLLAGISLTPNFSVEAGYYYLYTEQDEEESDTTGQFNVSITSSDFLLGGKGQVNLNRLISLYVRGGALFWNTELELEEEFFGIVDGGKISKKDDGIGYYLSGGIVLHFTKRLYMDAYLATHQRTGVFEEDSERPIDVTETLGGVGIGFKF